jgi:deoxyribodipyrimidine photo-lyase
MWFRRDLRLHDNAALFHALKDSRRVCCTLVFDRAILCELLAGRERADRRVECTHRAVAEPRGGLHTSGGDLVLRHGVAADEVVGLADSLGVDAVFANARYEPYARERDDRLAGVLQRYAAVRP